MSKRYINSTINFIEEVFYKKIRDAGLFIPLEISVDIKNNKLYIKSERINKYKKILINQFDIDDIQLNHACLKLKENLNVILNLDISFIKRIDGKFIKIYLK